MIECVSNIGEIGRQAFLAWRIAVTLFTQDLIAVAISDASGKISQVNEKFAKLLGYQRLDLETTSWKKITHPDDLKLDEEMVKLAEKEKLAGYKLKKRYITKDGYKPFIITVYRINGNFSSCGIYVVFVEPSSEPITKAEVIEKF